MPRACPDSRNRSAFRTGAFRRVRQTSLQPEAIDQHRRARASSCRMLVRFCSRAKDFWQALPQNPARSRSGVVRMIQTVNPRSPEFSRRSFLKTSTVAAAAATLLPRDMHAAPTSEKMVGIQVGAVSFVDEGTEKVLDVVQERGAVNTIFLATFTYGRGIGGRQVQGQPLPDHGKQEYDLDYHGGNFATPHAKYYERTSLKQTKAP